MRKVLPTPREMIAHLDKYIRGQDAAKRVLSKAVYFHYLKTVQDWQRAPVTVPEHVLLIGPTGSGKTHLVRTLAKFLRVPLLFCNASSLTAEGYVGESVGDMLARLSRACNNDPFLKARAIVYLDEFDKLAGATSEREQIGTLKVQHELLAVLDGNQLSREKESEHTPSYDIDTSKVLFIASGAFTGIEKIIRSRNGALGFSNQGVHSETAERNNAEILPEDVRKYGFIPELVGRFTNLAVLNALDESDLFEILSTRAQSPLSVHQDLYRLHGVKLKFTGAALRKLARAAYAEKEGARALRRTLGNVLTDLDWRISDYRAEGISAIRIGEDCIGGKGAPELIRGDTNSPDRGETLRKQVFCNAERPDPERKKSEEAARHLERARAFISWKKCRGRCRDWWREFEEMNKAAPHTIAALAEEIQLKGGNLKAFYVAYIESGCDHPGDILEYMAKRTSATLPAKS